MSRKVTAYNKAIHAIKLAKQKVASDIKKIKQAEAYVAKVAQADPVDLVLSGGKALSYNGVNVLFEGSAPYSNQQEYLKDPSGYGNEGIVTLMAEDSSSPSNGRSYQSTIQALESIAHQSLNFSEDQGGTGLPTADLGDIDIRDLISGLLQAGATITSPIYPK